MAQKQPNPWPPPGGEQKRPIPPPPLPPPRDVIAETVFLLGDADDLGAELSPDDLRLAEALARGLSNP